VIVNIKGRIAHRHPKSPSLGHNAGRPVRALIDEPAEIAVIGQIPRLITRLIRHRKRWHKHPNPDDNDKNP
jgi:hypothetical protein